MTTSNAITQRPDLGKVVVEKFDASEGYIGLELLPKIVVPNNAGIYPIIPHGVLTKDEAPVTHTDGREYLLRNPREGFEKTGYSYLRGNYQTMEFGLETDLDTIEHALMAQETPNAMHDEIAIDRIVEVMKRAREKRILNSLLADPAFVADKKAVDVPWTDLGAADPIKDIKLAMMDFRLKSGKTADVLVISYDVAQAMSMTASIRAAIAAAPNALDLVHLNAAQLSSLLNVRVLVAGAVHDAAIGYDKAADFTNLFPNGTAMLMNIAGGDWNGKAGVGRTPVWAGPYGAGVMVETYARPEVSGYTYRVRCYEGTCLFRAVSNTLSVTDDIAAKNIQLIDIDPAV